jgi:UbiD family decarboxylase
MVTLCQDYGLPIDDAYAPFETMATWCALKVNIKRLGELKTNPTELSNKIGNLLFNNKSATLVNRIFLIGDDVDIYSFKDIIWAFSTRSRPGLDDFVFDNVRGFPMMPYMSHGTGHPKRGGKMVTSCLLPSEYSGIRNWIPVDFNSSYPEHVKEKVESLWKTIGLGG